MNEDGDGPVEVCIPVAPGAVAQGEDIIRVEPAHTEAYTRIRKAQVAYPQILSAFGAVESWLESQGQQRAGPPREVYFNDFMAAKPEDDACDIAFPIN